MRPAKDHKRVLHFRGRWPIVDKMVLAFDKTHRKYSVSSADGDDRGVLHFDVEPGTLVIFRGLHSLHRSSPVEGPRRRLIAVMLFERHPGVTGTAAVNAMLYGPRVAAQVNLPTG